MQFVFTRFSDVFFSELSLLSLSFCHGHHLFDPSTPRLPRGNRPGSAVQTGAATRRAWSGMRWRQDGTLRKAGGGLL
jgi:hypothetical protein